MIGRYRKAIAALFGAATPAIVISSLDAVGMHVDMAIATGICTILATAATILAPANDAAVPRPTPSKIGAS